MWPNLAFGKDLCRSGLPTMLCLHFCLGPRRRWVINFIPSYDINFKFKFLRTGSTKKLEILYGYYIWPTLKKILIRFVRIMSLGQNPFKNELTFSRGAIGINLNKNKFYNPLAFMGWALRPCKVKCYKGLQHIQDMS